MIILAGADLTFESVILNTLLSQNVLHPLQLCWLYLRTGLRTRFRTCFHSGPMHWDVNWSTGYRRREQKDGADWSAGNCWKSHHRARRGSTRICEEGIKKNIIRVAWKHYLLVTAHYDNLVDINLTHLLICCWSKFALGAISGSECKGGKHRRDERCRWSVGSSCGRLRLILYFGWNEWLK